MTKRYFVFTLFLGGVGIACESPTTALSCGQTYEFGNHGCAVIALRIEPPAEPLPDFSRIAFSAIPARTGTGADVTTRNSNSLSENVLTVIRYSRPDPGSEDTASFWIVTRMLEMPESTVFAIDSVLQVLRFAPVGGRVDVDTVVMQLRIK